jgi:AcrR family transcriptional regulator
MTLNTEVQARIFNQAHDLFMQFGLKSVSMDDIASKMGISKKTIYQYFEDKEELVSAVVKAITSQNEEVCNNDIIRSENAVHEIFLAMEQMSTLFHKMNPSILFDLQKYYPNAFKIFFTHKNEFIYKKIKDNLKRGIKEDLYKNDIDIEILSRFRVESIVMPFNPDFQSVLKKNLVELSQVLSTHFLFGIATTKGEKQINKYIKNQTKYSI